MAKKLAKAPAEPRRRGRKKANPDTGLFERVHGSGIWWIQWHDAQGKRHREKVGSKDAARTLYMKRKTQVLRDEKLPELQPKKAVTVTAMIERYRPRFQAKKSAQCDVRYARYWTEALGSMAITEVRPSDIEAWRARRLKEDKVAPATVNRACSFLKAIFNLAIRDEIFEGSNPLVKVKKLKENNERVRYLSLDEEAALRPTCSADLWRKVEIAYLSGLRQMEQFRLQREDLDFQARVITIRESKHGEARRIPMSDRLAELFTEQLAQHGGEWVFPGRDPAEHFSGSGAIHSLQRACKKVGIKGFRWHDLRHTFCSRLAMAGASLATIQSLAGHKTITVTQRYAHLSPENNRAAMELLAPKPKSAKEPPIPWADTNALAELLVETLEEANPCCACRPTFPAPHLRIVSSLAT